MVKVYLNNTELSDEPIGIDSLKETIQYDRDKLGVIKTFPIELYFAGQGYEIIYNYIRDNGFLFNLPFELKSRNTDNDVFTTYFTGYIRLASCEFLNYENDCKVKAFVVDTSTIVQINNNRNIKVNLSGTKSKNGVDITPITQSNIKMFDTSTGSYYASTKRYYEIHDVFEFIIAYISDNNMTFISDYFSTATAENTFFAITLGVIVRNVSTDNQIEISLAELLQEMYVKFNIRWDVYVDAYGNNVFRVENEDFFRDLNSSVSINSVDNIDVSFDNLHLYSQITLGGETIDNNDSLYTLPTLDLVGFKSESYNIQNDTGTSATLDLSAQWIADSNILDGLASGAIVDDTYDNSILLLEYTKSSPTYLAYKYNYVGLYGLSFYNYNLTNRLVVSRFQLQGTIAKYLQGNDDNNFYGYSAADITYDFVSATPQTIQLKFDTELLDTNGNYSPITGRYTAPFNGLFGFDINTCFTVNTSAVATTIPGVLAPKVYTVRLYYKLNGVTEVDMYLTSNVADYEDTNIFYNSSYPQIYLDAGDYVEFFYDIEIYLKGDLTPADYNYYGVLVLQATNGLYANVDYLNGKTVVYSIYGIWAQPYTPTTKELSFLGVTALSYSGGTFGGTNPNQYYGAILKFTHPIRKDIWDAIQNNKNKSILVNGIYKGWINNITRDFTTGIAEFELISNIENTF